MKNECGYGTVRTDTLLDYDVESCTLASASISVGHGNVVAGFGSASCLGSGPGPGSDPGPRSPRKMACLAAMVGLSALIGMGTGMAILLRKLV